jgi:hypothetical protein
MIIGIWLLHLQHSRGRARGRRRRRKRRRRRRDRRAPKEKEEEEGRTSESPHRDSLSQLCKSPQFSRLRLVFQNFIPFFRPKVHFYSSFPTTTTTRKISNPLFLIYFY